MSAISETYNCDCYEYMRTLPDKYFDLCIADPPYGIAADARQQNRAGKQHGNAAAASRDYGTVQSWDLQAPAQEVFDEIFRVSRHQVIFGANHFISRMPYDASCWLVWDKDLALQTNNVKKCCSIVKKAFVLKTSQSLSGVGVRLQDASVTAKTIPIIRDKADARRSALSLTRHLASSSRSR